MGAFYCWNGIRPYVSCLFCFSFYAAEMDLPLSLDVDIPGQEMAIPWPFYYSDWANPSRL